MSPLTIGIIDKRNIITQTQFLSGMRGVQWMTMMNGSGTFGINQERYLARYSIYGA